MGSKYALRRNLRLERVILVTGMCLVLAAQQERRRQRIVKIIVAGGYAIFGIELVAFWGALERGYWITALIALYVAYCCAAYIAATRA